MRSHYGKLKQRYEREESVHRAENCTSRPSVKFNDYINSFKLLPIVFLDQKKLFSVGSPVQTIVIDISIPIRSVLTNILTVETKNV